MGSSHHKGLQLTNRLSSSLFHTPTVAGRKQDVKRENRLNACCTWVVLTPSLKNSARLLPNTKLPQWYWYPAPSHENYAFWWNWQQRPVSPTQPFVLMETA